MKTLHKVIVTVDTSEVNYFTDKGWLVKMIVPQNVAASEESIRGKFCFLLEKEIENSNDNLS